MRKLTCLLLVVLLGFSSSAFAEESVADKALHTLWGIPWSTTSIELPDAIYNVTSIAVSEIVNNLFESDSNQNIKVLGIDAASVHFACYDEGETLSSAWFSFGGDPLPNRNLIKTPNEIDLPSIQTFDDLYKACVEEYGMPTNLYAYYYEDEKPDEKTFLTVKSEINDSVYYSLKRLALGHDNTVLNINFNNISLTYFFLWTDKLNLTRVMISFSGKNGEEERQYSGILDAENDTEEPAKDDDPKEMQGEESTVPLAGVKTMPEVSESEIVAIKAMMEELAKKYFQDAETYQIVYSDDAGFSLLKRIDGSYVQELYSRITRNDTEAIAAWDAVKEVFISLSNTFSNSASYLTNAPSLVFVNLVNNEDAKIGFLSVLNGMVIYDVMDE